MLSLRGIYSAWDLGVIGTSSQRLLHSALLAYQDVFWSRQHSLLCHHQDGRTRIHPLPRDTPAELGISSSRTYHNTVFLNLKRYLFLSYIQPLVFIASMLLTPRGTFTT